MTMNTPSDPFSKIAEQGQEAMSGAVRTWAEAVQRLSGQPGGSTPDVSAVVDNAFNSPSGCSPRSASSPRRCCRPMPRPRRRSPTPPRRRCTAPRSRVPRRRQRPTPRPTSSSAQPSVNRSTDAAGSSSDAATSSVDTATSSGDARSACGHAKGTGVQEVTRLRLPQRTAGKDRTARYGAAAAPSGTTATTSAVTDATGEEDLVTEMREDEVGGEAICSGCDGSGKVDREQCSTCGGSGKVVEPVGGA